MDFENWTVAANGYSAEHVSGFRIEIEGNPKAPSAVHPVNIPKQLSSLEQVRLLRYGVESIIAEAKLKTTRTSAKTKPQVIKKHINRPKLSLRKSNTVTEMDED